MSATALREEHSPVCTQTGKLPQSELEVGLLTGGQDPHYVFGLAMALIAQGVGLDVIGSDLVDCREMHITPRLRFLNLHGSMQEASVGIKIKRILLSYARLIQYATKDKPKIFHILWNNKFEFFDRTLLLLYYKLLGKKPMETDTFPPIETLIGVNSDVSFRQHSSGHTDQPNWPFFIDFAAKHL